MNSRRLRGTIIVCFCHLLNIVRICIKYRRYFLCHYSGRVICLCYLSTGLICIEGSCTCRYFCSCAVIAIYCIRCDFSKLIISIGLISSVINISISVIMCTSLTNHITITIESFIQRNKRIAIIASVSPFCYCIIITIEDFSFCFFLLIICVNLKLFNRISVFCIRPIAYRKNIPRRIIFRIYISRLLMRFLVIVLVFINL